MIDRATISRIMDAADIVDVVSEFVTLRKAGVNYKGLCPFHNERTPSFVVSPSKQLCKCFSCGKGGNVVHFIMEHEQMTWPEALKWLARRYGIEVKERELTAEEKMAETERESLFILNEWARDYFADVLRNHEDGRTVGMAYFRQRGFRDDTISKFQLGYSPASRDALARAALAKGFRRDYLVKTGLCYETEDGRLLDRYHGRVIFPVHTVSGKVVAFGGRVMNTNGKVAKYVNSPESDIYHKSNELYGLYLAKHAIVRQERCFLVEGYTDVISMHQSGVENVVASSGTSLTEGQIRLIHRFTENITVLYDGDMAGIKASLRGIDMLLREGLNIKVLLLPDGDDPDSFARKHTAEEFQAYIDRHQVDFICFKTNLLLADCGDDPVKRASLITDIVKSIAVIPDAIVRQMYVRECAAMMEVDEKLVVDAVAKVRRAEREARRKAEENRASAHEPPAPRAEDVPAVRPDEPAVEAAAVATTGTSMEEELLLQLVVRYGELPAGIVDDGAGGEKTVSVIEYVATDLAAEELTFRNALYARMLSEAVEHLGDEGFRAMDYFIQHPDPEVSRVAARLVADRYQLSRYHFKQRSAEPDAPLEQLMEQSPLNDRNRLSELTPRLLMDFKYSVVKEEMEAILRSMNRPATAADATACATLMKRYMELAEVERNLARALGDRVVTL